MRAATPSPVPHHWALSCPVDPQGLRTLDLTSACLVPLGGLDPVSRGPWPPPTHPDSHTGRAFSPPLALPPRPGVRLPAHPSGERGGRGSLLGASERGYLFRKLSLGGVTPGMTKATCNPAPDGPPQGAAEPGCGPGTASGGQRGPRGRSGGLPLWAGAASCVLSPIPSDPHPAPPPQLSRTLSGVAARWGPSGVGVVPLRPGRSCPWLRPLAPSCCKLPADFLRFY